MSVGLLTNAQASFSMTADAVTTGHTTSIQALSLVLSAQGGREIKGQLYIDPDAAAQVDGYTQGTPVTTHDSGGSPITVYDSIGNPITVYSQGTLIGPVGPETVRIDFTATLLDQAFEEQNIYGGQRTAQTDRAEQRY